MNKMLALLLFPICAFAGSPFDGTWKTDYATSKIIKNATWTNEIKDGHYRCLKGCASQVIDVATDGKDHPVQGFDISDHLAVELQGDSKYTRTFKKGATVIAKCVATVSADGAQVTQDCVDYTGAKPFENRNVLARVGKADPTAHKGSGTWTAAEKGWSGDESVMQLESTPNGIKLTQNGQIVDARFDGKEYPTQNDPAHTMNVLRRIDERRIEWTSKTKGKATGRDDMAVSADGHTITDTFTNLTNDSVFSVELRKQP
jgi:hypothetical protein